MTSENLAFVFPGQGSQKIGMLANMAAASPLVEATFAEASAVLGYNLWDLVQGGAQEDINLTERTQPILLTASVALWRIWQEQSGPAPRLLAGHSLGEWSALVCAGVVTFEDAVRLVQARGKFMQAAVAPGAGAMAAVIGLDDDAVKAACVQAAESEVVAPVNFNSPGQVVIAGDKAAVDRAIVLCKDAGAKRAMPLPVSAPFHTALMRPAADQLARRVEQTAFAPPAIPVVHNVHAQTAADAGKIKALMIEQIYSPVLWVDCVNALVAAGIDTIVECGPGKVLSGLNKRIQRGLGSYGIETPAELDKALEELSRVG